MIVQAIVQKGVRPKVAQTELDIPPVFDMKRAPLGFPPAPRPFCSQSIPLRGECALGECFNWNVVRELDGKRRHSIR